MMTTILEKIARFPFLFFRKCTVKDEVVFWQIFFNLTASTACVHHVYTEHNFPKKYVLKIKLKKKCSSEQP